jgi:EmrB/QacA subfamily drug resistance transporter
VDKPAVSRAGVMSAVVVGSAMVFLDGTVVNVALPKIGQELPSTLFGTLEAQSYVYNVYLLSLSSLLILAGALGDHYGRRRMFALGLIGFTLTSVLCGIAPTMELLIAARFLQGAAGALLVPGSLSIITANFPEGEPRGRALGIWAGATTLVTLAGPLVGGFLVDTISWRAAFLINVPLGAVALWTTLRFVPESRDESVTSRLDWLGATVVAVAIGGLVLGAIRGQQSQWQDTEAWVALVVGLAAAIVFPFLMMRRADPLVPPDLFRNSNFTITNISTLLVYGGIYVVGYVMALFLQGTVGYTALAAGLAGIPGFLLLGLFSERFGVFAGRYGPRRFMVIGPAVMALGILWLGRFPSDSQPWRLIAGDPSSWLPPTSYLTDVLPAMLIYGFGLTMLVAPLTTALMGSVPVERAGLASAINNAVSRVGPQLAGAAIFIAITAVFYAQLAVSVPSLDVGNPDVRAQVAPLNPPADEVSPDVAAAAGAASTNSFRVAMWISAGLMAAGALVNLRISDAPQHVAGAAVPRHPAAPLLLKEEDPGT